MIASHFHRLEGQLAFEHATVHEQRNKGNSIRREKVGESKNKTKGNIVSKNGIEKRKKRDETNVQYNATLLLISTILKFNPALPSRIQADNTFTNANNRLVNIAKENMNEKKMDKTKMKKSSLVEQRETHIGIVFLI